MTKTAIALRDIEDAVHSACRAPSFHNSQPWTWVLESTTLKLFVDPDQLVDTDSAGRQALLSCGAALDHLRVIMAARGWDTLVDRFPNPNNRYHVADIEFRPSAGVTPAQLRDADAVAHRRTDRLPYDPVENVEAFELLLRLAVEDRPTHVDLIAPHQRGELAKASHLAEALRMYDTAYHSELAWWTAPFGATTGIPHSALISAAESDRVEVGRAFPVTHTKERRQHTGDDQATIVVISSSDDTPQDILACGETLSAVLIEATGAGLASCILTHVTEHPATRDIVGGLTGNPRPQALVRIGVAPALDDVPPPTPRRPLSDVFHVRLE